MTALAVRTLSWRDVALDELIAAKGDTRVSVCLPARDEEATVGDIVATIVTELVDGAGLVDEVVVLDDRSVDGTARVASAAGARVVAGTDVLPELGPGGGKGDALWKSLVVSDGDVVVWCDADVRQFPTHFVTGLLAPLLLDHSTHFVKGFYERPLDGRLGEGGRVTELVARPLVSTFFPELASVVQPLAGEYAGRRALLERLPFVHGYGVDLALLVDASRLVGIGGLAQVDLGTRVHRNRPLDELAPQAAAILRTALDRAGIPWHHDWGTVLQRPGLPGVSIDLDERPPLVEVDAYRRRTA